MNLPTSFRWLRSSRGLGASEAIVGAAVLALIVLFVFNKRNQFGKFFRAVPGQSITATPDCSDKSKQPRLLLDAHKRPQYISGKVAIAIGAWGDCVTVGKIPIFWFQNLDSDLNGYSFPSNLVADVSRLKVVAKSELTDDVIRLAGSENTAAFRKALDDLSKQFHSSGSVVSIAEFKIIHSADLRIKRLAPTELNFAKVLAPGSIDSKLAQGASLVDVRPVEQFKAHHHLKAINVPYLIKNSIRKAVLRDFISQDSYPLQQLPLPLNKPLIFLGASEYDFSPVRALAAARGAGHTELFWWRGGEAERLGAPALTEKTYGEMETISIRDVEKIIAQKKPYILDTRPQVDFGRAHIPGAVNNYYEENSQMHRKISGQTRQSLVADRDSFTLPQVKVKDSILVYGYDEGDFAPAKAALWLRADQWKHVYWLREGIERWEEQKKHPSK